MRNKNFPVRFINIFIGSRQTFSVRACARTRTRAGAAIFVQIGAEKFSETCMRVRAPHITIFVRCACGCGPKSPHTKGLVELYTTIIVMVVFNSTMGDPLTIESCMRDYF